MKKIIFFLILLLSALTVKAQQQLSYAYDAAGNRVSRTIVMTTLSASATTNQTDSVYFEEMLAEKMIKLYPNPVESELTIRITGYESSFQGEYALFNMGGIMLSRNRITSETTLVDMNRYMPGTYLLNITLRGEKSVWKIIKQ